MTINRFSTYCEHGDCQNKSDEYAAYPTCRVCGDYVCGVHQSEEPDEDGNTICPNCVES